MSQKTPQKEEILSNPHSDWRDLAELLTDMFQHPERCQYRAARTLFTQHLASNQQGRALLDEVRENQSNEPPER